MTLRHISYNILAKYSQLLNGGGAKMNNEYFLAKLNDFGTPYILNKKKIPTLDVFVHK